MKPISSSPGAKAPRWLLLALLCLMALVPAVHAQYEMKSGVYNRLSQRIPQPNPNQITPLGNPPVVPTGAPTITPQFSNVVESSASAGPTGITVPGGLPIFPKSTAGAGVILTRASLGTTFSSGVPRYSFGDHITPPAVIVNAGGTSTPITDPATYWRAEPVRPGEVLSNPSGNPAVDYKTGESATVAPLPAGALSSYYYSPHAKVVFANTPGVVEVTWRSSVPDSTNNYVFLKERFTVSSSSRITERPMYWTEKSFNGPRITIPTGRIVTVNPVYSNIFPASVTSEYVVVGSSAEDPNAGASQVLRTLWYEKANGVGELHAYNHEGRILIEYLGELNADGTHQFLGADIVHVQQSLKATTIRVKLGEEILPDSSEILVAKPVQNTTGEQASYYGSNPRADGSLAYYAERENDIEDRVVFYWLQTQDAAIDKSADVPASLAINWPTQLAKYIHYWPDGVTEFVHYTVGAQGSSVDTGTGLKFEDGKIPALVYQDSTTGEAVIDTVTQRLIVAIGSDGQNRTLLKFTGSNGGVWYVRLMTQVEDGSGFKEGDGGTAVNGIAYIGERIQPPSSAYRPAGYISTGTGYSPNAYIDPFAGGVAAAEKGAIIPVNTSPDATKNQIKVWWFQKIEAKAPEFSAFYVPSKIGRYTPTYRTSTTVAMESFDAGATGWSNNATALLGGAGGTSGSYLGPFTKAAAAATPVTQKTYALAGNEGNGAEIGFTFYRLDSWDGENFQVYVDGSTIISRAYSMAQVTDSPGGTVAIGSKSYTWSITPVAGSFKNQNGDAGALVDQAFHVSIKVTPQTGTSISSVTLGMGSTLDEVVTNESFAIDDVSISVPLPRIILASNLGTGPLSAPMLAGGIYYQPDPAKPGYNPNEEHALIVDGTGYALRDDLNITTGSTFSSLPRVLLQYTDPADNRPSMSVYEVVRENSIVRFSYHVTAGSRLNAPFPLPLIPLPVNADGSVKNSEVPLPASYQDFPVGAGAPADYKNFTFPDRKGYHWVYRGPHAGGAPALGMRFYYVMRSDFHFPNAPSQPAIGSLLPYLRAMDTTTGNYVGQPANADSLIIYYYPAWPANPPTLSIGETLALAKNGLPGVRGNTSAQIVYQQSIANSGSAKPSAILHDPTRAKTVLLNASGVNLTALPSSVLTTSSHGKTYFQLAQPHLQQRFYFNPDLGTIGGLEFIGEFKDEIAGEDYLNLNTLSPADVAALKGLVSDQDPDKGGWYAAIDALSTAVETFKANPSVPGTYIPDTGKTVQVGGQVLPEISSSETAVDSYALTAPGKGDGYVTLVFGNGKAFTPIGEPVSIYIIDVVPELYQGDLKVVSASNPLDEQTSLRHSGDFAAHPENYTFEWRYATAVDGSAPATYSSSMQGAAGFTGGNTWFRITNPTTFPPATLTYPGTAAVLPNPLSINSASYVATSAPPGQLLKSANGLTFQGAVPERIIFSGKLGATDGLVLYVNGVPALAYQLPAASSIPGGLVPQAPRSGLAEGGYPYQFEVDRNFFLVGTNKIEVALYSPQPAGTVGSAIDFRVDVMTTTDLVTDTTWQNAGSGLTNTVVIGGSAASIAGDPLMVFSDLYFTMRYTPKTSAGLPALPASNWTTPVLVESWVKRVLDGINPFNQRQTDLYNNPVTTDVSILTQAGGRWEGDVALNLENIDAFGLIEIYETVLNRVKNQSLDAGVTTASVNSTLLLVAGYLNDLYMTLGNEAWDDAQNPTILIDADPASAEISSARFSFEAQTATLMDETLSLLRGRDDFLDPGTRVGPAYNRLYWNYTNGISSGEAIYAVNYNIKEKAGSANANGVVDAADAQAMFPQGHGDAYGHYLTAVTNYYKLLTSPVFTWTPTTEGVSVLGQTVQVDYQDERKFASAAASLARTGVDVLDFTARKNHQDNEAYGWSGKSETGANKKENTKYATERHWGTDEWSSRVVQGSYYNWVSANAMLPDVDPNKNHEGIQKIDRTTVPELDELVTSATRALALSDGEQAHLNPLGLAKDAMTFDISPAELAAGKSHFEQIYERATKAAVNAKNAFQQAGKMNQLLRQQNNSVDSYNEAVTKQEDAYTYQLISLCGTAYAGDIGPGKLYSQGYAGPDLYHYNFIDRPSPLVSVEDDVTVNFREPVNHDPFTAWSIDNVYNRLNDPVQYVTRSYRMAPNSLAQFSDSVTAGLGKRSQTGAIQAALLEAYEAQVNLRKTSNTFSTLMRRFDRDYQLYSEFLTDYDAANQAAAQKSAEAAAMSKASFALTTSAAAFGLTADYISALAEASAEAAPTDVGLANDATSVARSIALLTGNTSSYAQQLLGLAAETQAALLDAEAADLQGEASAYIDDYNFDSVKKQHVIEFEHLYDDVLASAYEITGRLAELQRATEKVSRLFAEVTHVLSERETFRQRAASVIQGYRTRDSVYRDLRNEELSQYKELFDLAQTFTYCATKAYDYETGLLGSAVGQGFIDAVIGTYSVGDWQGNEPVESGSGDAGLASVLSGLRDDWEVAKGRLGINNPDRNGTVFSLRQELFRIRTDQPTADDNLLWKQVLQQHMMSNVLNDPDVGIYCNNIRKANGSAVPGIVISFSTTIQEGLNFFGWPLAAGDHYFSQSNFATKIHSSGLVFKGYSGMDPYAVGVPGASGPASSGTNSLSATPYAYLIPAGVDSMRAPALGDTNDVRSWTVKDQALPLPKNLGASSFSSSQFFTPQGSLNEQLWITRKHQAFRAVDDPVYFYSSMPAEFTNSRLVGRSVWNSQWKIVIPAYSLLNDEQVGLDRFAQSVSDIKLFLRTYSNSGN